MFGENKVVLKNDVKKLLHQGIAFVIAGVFCLIMFLLNTQDMHQKMDTQTLGLLLLPAASIGLLGIGVKSLKDYKLLSAYFKANPVGETTLLTAKRWQAKDAGKAAVCTARNTAAAQAARQDSRTASSGAFSTGKPVVVCPDCSTRNYVSRVNDQTIKCAMCGARITVNQGTVR